MSVGTHDDLRREGQAVAVKPTVWFVTIAALFLFLLSACAESNLRGDAEDLRDRLGELPGVSKVSLNYTDPITLDSGKLELRVQMRQDADVDQITTVITTTYASFADTHQREEGDLDVAVGDSRLHLRSFEPDAEVNDVEQAAARAVAVLSSGSVRADINTQDVTRAPHVFTQFTVSVQEPGRDSVLKKLAALEREHADIPDASWSVQSGGEAGWLIGSDQGFPDAPVLSLFDKLSEDLPAGATVLLDQDVATVILPVGISPAEASAVVGRHLTLLGGARKAFYNVESDQGLVAAIIDGDCYFDTGTIGDRLTSDHGAGCSAVSRPGA